MSIIINHPEDMNKFIDKSIRIIQSNLIEIQGKVTGVFIDQTGKTPNKLSIEQKQLRSSRVGAIRRPNGNAIATVY